MSKFHCSTYPYLGLLFPPTPKYGASVGLPLAATKLEIFGVVNPSKLRPGGAMIPELPNGPDSAQPNPFGPLSGNTDVPANVYEQPSPSNMAAGVTNKSFVACSGVLARFTTSLSGFNPNDT